MGRRAWRWAVLVLALPLGWWAGTLWDEGGEAQAAVVSAPPQAAPPRPAATAPQVRPAPAPLPAAASVAAADGTAAPRNVVATEYHPRPEGEWQGMRVNLALRATCERSEGCGLAMACREGLCGPCEADGDCAGGEVCVLDHCVPRAQASCRSRSDCGEEELCVLSGYSSDARNNGGLRALCLSGRGGEEE